MAKLKQVAPEIYGLSFHSPLTIQLLLPKTFQPIYLAHDWGGINFKKNVEPSVKRLSANKIPIVLAGSVTVLKQFLKEFPDVKNLKVLLFDFPGVLVPFEDPLIQWLDCDHQAGGAWQTSKIKPERLEEDLSLLNTLGERGRDLISRMQRYLPRSSRLSEIEAFAEMFAEGLPQDYKDLLTKGDGDEEEPEEIDYKKQTLEQLLSDVCSFFPDPAKRKQVVALALGYQLGRRQKRDYTATFNKFTGDDEHLRKMGVLLRKWMDDKKLGRALYSRYLDYLANLERRSWQTILSEGKQRVADGDLLMLIEFQPRSSELLSDYKDELKAFHGLEADTPLPKKTFKDSLGESLYHPEPPHLQELFTF